MTDEPADPPPPALTSEEINTLREMAEYYRHRAWLWDIAVRWGKAGLVVATGAVAIKTLFGDYLAAIWKAIILK